jgi:hypothetical protein
MSHRSHPNEIDIHLFSTRADIKPYLDQLNPILQNIVSILQTAPLDPTEVAPVPGYHNITFCSH